MKIYKLRSIKINYSMDAINHNLKSKSYNQDQQKVTKISLNRIHHDQLIHQFFQILGHLIFDYFIEPLSKNKNSCFSNHCNELKNLLQCCKMINHLMKKQYILRGRFFFDDVILFDAKNKLLIRDLIYSQPINKSILGNKLIEGSPCIQKLVLNDYIYSKKQLNQNTDVYDFKNHKIITNKKNYIQVHQIPENLLELKMLSSYHVINELPPKLLSLDLRFYSIEPINIKSGWFPLTLKILRMPYYHNQPLVPDLLPTNLHTLQFGNDFNQKIDHGILPNNLTKLIFGKRFNQELIR